MMSAPNDHDHNHRAGSHGDADNANPSAAAQWNTRYSSPEHVWSPDPNEFVEEFAGTLAPGTAIDVATGEGRHALWLAQRGWKVQAFDISDVGVDKGRAAARNADVDIAWSVADVSSFDPDPAKVDLVVMSYVHLDVEHMVDHVMPKVRSWLAPGGHLVLVAHAKRNLKDGVGGPKDPSILLTIGDAERFGMGLMILSAEERIRTTDAGDAIDIVLHAVAAS